MYKLSLHIKISMSCIKYSGFNTSNKQSRQHLWHNANLSKIDDQIVIQQLTSWWSWLGHLIFFLFHFFISVAAVVLWLAKSLLKSVSLHLLYSCHHSHEHSEKCVMPCCVIKRMFRRKYKNVSQDHCIDTFHCTLTAFKTQNTSYASKK